MPTRHPLFGLALATFGAVLITPDTLFMRWTGMSGATMLAWRGMTTGAIMILTWVIMCKGRIGPDLTALCRPAGLSVIATTSVNTALFAIGVANAPAAIVLFAMATVPIFAVAFAHLVAKEQTARGTWLATSTVMFGIGLAVFGHDSTGIGANMASLFGALAGLGVAAAIAMTFVTVRHSPGLPILPTMGLGAFLAGCGALIMVGPATLLQGNVWAALASAAVILPGSFMALSFATRHTAAVNVSLLMLLETIFGPAWVWYGTGEAMAPVQILGGAVVVVSLAAYLIASGRQAVSV